MLYRLGRLTINCFLKLFFNLVLEGEDVFPSKGPFILASNHPSHFDPPLLAAVVKRRVWFLAKEELFRGWIARIFFHNLGAIPVKRNSSDFRAMRRSLDILEERPLLVFPQGLVAAPWEQVNSGVGFLAKKSGVPLVAARIYGSENVFPISKSLFKRKTIKVIFSPIQEVNLDQTSKVVAEKIMAKIKSF